MSRNKVNQDGSLSMIAGRGKAEYGASTVRTGRAYVAVTKDTAVTVAVTFDEPMPDASYLVDIYNMSQHSFWTISGKTANGFNLHVKSTVTDSTYGVTYTAFKLYTDTEYNNIIDAVPSSASSSNQLVTESDLNKTTESENTYLKATFSKSGRNIIVDIVTKQTLAQGADYVLDIPNGFEPLADTTSGYMHNNSGSLGIGTVASLIAVYKSSNVLTFYTYQSIANGSKGVCSYISAS